MFKFLFVFLSRYNIIDRKFLVCFEDQKNWKYIVIWMSSLCFKGFDAIVSQSLIVFLFLLFLSVFVVV